MSLLGIAAIGGIGHHMGKKHEQKKEGTESSYEEYLRVTYLLFPAKALAAAQQQQAMAYSYPPAPHYQQAHPAPPPPTPSRHATAPMLSAAEARSWRSLSELPPHCKNLTLTSSEMHHSHQKLPFFFSLRADSYSRWSFSKLFIRNTSRRKCSRALVLEIDSSTSISSL